MNKIRRIYNQNRALIIAVVLTLALILLIIQVLNGIIKTQNEEKANKTSNSSTNNSAAISQSNVSTITGETVTSNKTDQKLIKQFVDYCNQGKYNEAYDMLTEDCKKIIYKTPEDFKKDYVDRIFSEYRIYSLENWYTSGDFNTYSIKYLEDILASGNTKSSNNVGDYITIVKSRNGNFLNINSFVGSEEIGKSQTQSGVTIAANKIYFYINYAIINFTFTNTSANKVCIDTKESLKTAYIYDTNGIKYTAFLNENSDIQLNVDKNTKKDVDVKFNKMYSPANRELKGIQFNDVVVNYEKYIQKEEEKEKLSFDIDI